MSDWISGALGGAGSVIAGAMNWASQVGTNQLNEKLTREAWAREDTAMQRKVADLKAAGINPMMAAGGPGSPTSAPARMEAPELRGNPVADALAAAAAANAIAQTKAQTKLTEANAESVRLDNSYKEQTLDNRVLQSMHELSKVTWQAGLSGIEYQVAQKSQEAKISVNEQAAAKAVVETKAAGVDLDRRVVELVANQLALELKRYDAEWYQSAGLPTSGNTGQMVQASAVGKEVGMRPGTLVLLEKAIEAVMHGAAIAAAGR